MAQRLRDVDKLLSNAKKKKQSKAFDRSGRRTEGPLTDEARDWAENNAGKQKQAEAAKRQPNAVKRKQQETLTPMTNVNRATGGWHHSSENEARLNANNEKEYNQAVNWITNRNTIIGRNSRKR